MIAPGGGGGVAHLKNIQDHFIHRSVLVAPDVVENSQGIDVQDGFSREMTKKKVDGWNWRCVAELQDSSQDLVLEDG